MASERSNLLFLFIVRKWPNWMWKLLTTIKHLCIEQSSSVDQYSIKQFLYSEISYSTVVLYSRDHAGVGVAFDRISPQN